jgi:hypothetical protein
VEISPGTFPFFIDDFILTSSVLYWIALSPNRVDLKKVIEGTYEIVFDREQMKDILIENWWESDFSNTHLLAAAALNCISGSMEYELDVLKKGARYDSLDSSIKWRFGKDESGRRIIDSMEITVNVVVQEGLRSEFGDVVDEHMNHGCTVTRSLKRGFPIQLNLVEK